MVRPRHQPIELIASGDELKDLKQRVSRRRLMQLAGAGGASFVAGCGGGGGEESPTATATEAGGMDTPTATEAPDTPTATEAEDMDTPTETETEEMETSTPATGAPEIIDQQLRSLTQANFEQITPQPWNAENSFQSEWQRLELAVVPETMNAPSNIEDSASVIFPGVAKSMELDFENSQVNVELQDDPPVTFADGTVCNVDHVFAHWDLVQGQIEMGESSESTLPLSWEANDEFSFTATLLPGNVQIRLLTAFFQGDLVQIPNTHPELHSEWIEGVRDATTTSALQNIYQELFGARFALDQMPTMSNGIFIPSDWNPDRILYETREDFPWGLGTGLPVDRMFSGVRQTAVAEGEQGQQQLVNATINNRQDTFTVSIKQTLRRFPDNWESWELSEATGIGLWFQPGNPGSKNFGAKTEKHRRRRKAVQALFDPAQLAQINDLKPAYESTMGFWRKRDFTQWVGDVRDQYEDFGNRDDGYVKTQKGNRYFQQDHSKNKNGYWTDDETGEVVTAEVMLGQDAEGGVTDPLLRNIPEQLNDLGVRATGKFVSGEQFDAATENREGDMIFSDGNCEMHPHPYFGYREDCGLGSTEGLPVGLWWGDWHNGYRRVDVPFPIGDVDGQLGTYDWDKNVLQIAELSADAVQNRIKELSWVLNQWQPGIFAIAVTQFPAMNTDRIQPTDAWGDPTVLDKPSGIYDEGELWPTSDIYEDHMLAMGLLEPA